MSSRRAVVFAVASMIIWGLLPVYWKLLSHVGPIEVLMHRILWSAILLGAGLLFFNRFSGVKKIIKDRKTMLWLCASAFLIAANWLIYIWAVIAGEVLQSSMAYFMSPLFLVALGKLFFNEEWRPMQRAALGIMVVAMCVMAWQFVSVPWFAIGLLLTLPPYALCRKKTDVPPMDGLWIEAVMLSIPALLFLGYREASTQNVAFVHGDVTTRLLLVGAGVATSLPLWFYTAAVRKLHLKSMAVISYVSPSLQFILGYFVYNEPLDRPRLMAFVLIWGAVTIYLWDLWHDGRHQEKGIERLAAENEETM